MPLCALFGKSFSGFISDCGECNPPRKRIVLTKQQNRLRHDKSAAGDRGNDPSLHGFVKSFKNRTDDTLLPPDFSGGEFSIGGEAGEFGTGAGASGGAIVFPAGAEDKVTTVISGAVGGTEELDMIDFGIPGGADLFADFQTRLRELR